MKSLSEVNSIKIIQ